MKELGEEDKSRRPATNIYSGWGTKRGPCIPLYLDMYK